jgi:hypothetical protein
MNQESALRELLAPMTKRAIDLDGPGFRVDRGRVLARMAEASRRDRRGGLRYAVLAAAGIAVLVVGIGLWQREGGSSPSASLEVWVSEGHATQVRGVTHAEVAPRQSAHIAAAGDLETGPDSSARVRTVDGLQIELGSQTRLTVGELQPSTSQVKLLGGAIRCTIPHRTAPRAFQVVTPDITVVDLGTVFTVTVDGPNHATRVSVEEGEVLVRYALGQTRVQAPNTWTSAVVAEPSATAETAEAVASAPNSEPLPAGNAARSAAKEAHGEAVPAATLAQEAQLLRRGLAAERQGRSSDAISALTQLLSKYPHSPLIPDARAALARVEASSQR